MVKPQNVRFPQGPRLSEVRGTPSERMLSSIKFKGKKPSPWGMETHMSGHLKSSLYELGFVAIEIIWASMIWSSSHKSRQLLQEQYKIN